MYERYENFMLYVIGFYFWLRDKYIKYFPACALAFSLFYVYNLAGGIECGKVTSAHIPIVIITALIFTILTLIYFILILKDRAKGKRTRSRRRRRAIK